jgi:membrane-associated phospholipid phosphatase
MNFWARAAAAASMVLLAMPTTGAAAHRAAAPPAVGDWIETTLTEIVLHAVNPPRAARALALVSVAMDEAALRSNGSPSGRAAIAGAASTVLVYLFPDDRHRIRGLADDARSSAPEAARGFALGVRVGDEIVVRGQADGSGVGWTGAPPVGPEFWLPTPPGFVYPPLEPLAGTWRAWNVISGDALRPPQPPLPGSARFETELREVYDISLSLSTEQKRIADFWADGRGTFTPPGHWNKIALDLVRSHRLGDTSAALVFATLNTAQADAFICGWDAKFTYWSARPVTGIRRELDPNWLPYLVTPPFPSYVSGHATTSGAASEVLAHFFPGQAARLRAWAEEAALSRLLAGIHFRVDNEVGLALGRSVAAAAVSHIATGKHWLAP